MPKVYCWTMINMSHLAAEMNQLLEENGDTGIETVLEFGLFERSFASLPFSRMMGQFKYCQSRNGSLHRVASIIYLRKEWTIDQFYEKFAEGLPEPRMIHSTKSLIVGSEGTGASHAIRTDHASSGQITRVSPGAVGQPA